LAGGGGNRPPTWSKVGCSPAHAASANKTSANNRVTPPALTLPAAGRLSFRRG
jgi:hypothetical protein